MYKLDLQYNSTQNIKDRFKNLDNYRSGYCYELIYEMVQKNLIKDTDIIAFGYVKDETNFTIRHAFLIDENNKILDPLRTYDKSFNKNLVNDNNILSINLEYHIIDKLTLNQYKEALKNYQDDIKLKHYLFYKESLLINNDFIKNNYRINNHDYRSFIRDILINSNYQKVQILDDLSGEQIQVFNIDPNSPHNNPFFF